MKIVIVGGMGVVGSALGAYLKSFGHDVVLNDVKKTDGVEVDLERCLGDEDLVFVCVPTPSKNDGSIDLSIVEKITHEIGRIKRDTDNYSGNFPRIVYKSTMVPGSTRKMLSILKDFYSGCFDVAFNPEFLRQRFALEDTMGPSRIVVGSDNIMFAEEVMGLYNGTNAPKFIMALEEAELLKYYANAYYAARISFFNQMGFFADKYGCDHNMIVKAVVADPTVGVHGSNPIGRSWAGSCLPKDLSAIIRCGEKEGINTCLLKSVKKINKMMKDKEEGNTIKNWMGE